MVYPRCHLVGAVSLGMLMSCLLGRFFISFISLIYCSEDINRFFEGLCVEYNLKTNLARERFRAPQATGSINCAALDCRCAC